MRNLILALCVPLLLGACQDTSAQGPPPSFSPAVQAYFEKYMREINPTLFVVSTDGKYANYTYCPGHADLCLSARRASRSNVLRSCRGASGVPCEVYAVGHRVVWKGTAIPSSSTASRSNDSVCRLTLAIGDEGPRWDERSFLRRYVDEAKRRDLTPQKCAALLGREITE